MIYHARLGMETHEELRIGRGEESDKKNQSESETYQVSNIGGLAQEGGDASGPQHPSTPGSVSMPSWEQREVSAAVVAGLLA